MIQIIKKYRMWGENGQTMAIFALMLPMFLGTTTMAVEVGMVYMAKNQMQVVADSAALAAAQELVRDDRAAARTQAASMATSNTVTKKSMALNPNTDIEFGRWANGRFSSDPNVTDAVRVTVRKTQGSQNGALPLFFAPLMGVDTVDITATAVAKMSDIDLALVIDRSGSMDDDTRYRWRCCWRRVAVNGIQPMDTLRTAAKGFIDDLHEDVDKVGVVSYSSRATFTNTPPPSTDDDSSGGGVSMGYIDRPLTLNLTDAKTSIDNIPQPDGYTNIGDGIDKGIGELSSSRSRRSTVKIMILLSDGAPTCNSSGNCNSRTSTINAGRAYALAKAAEAAGQEITIHTISLGGSADRDLMQGIARATGGNEFFAATGSDLSQVFADIRERIPVRLTN